MADSEIRTGMETSECVRFRNMLPSFNNDQVEVSFLKRRNQLVILLIISSINLETTRKCVLSIHEDSPRGLTFVV